MCIVSHIFCLSFSLLICSFNCSSNDYILNKYCFVIEVDHSDELELAAQLGDLDLEAKHRSVTGVLASHPQSRDVHMIGITITFHGAELLVDSMLELNVGRRYGLIGELEY
jgi:hypothetical protein